MVPCGEISPELNKQIIRFAVEYLIWKQCKMDSLMYGFKYCSAECYTNYLTTVSGMMSNAKQGENIVLNLELFIFNWKKTQA